jgi:hypothetical protein
LRLQDANRSHEAAVGGEDLDLESLAVPEEEAIPRGRASLDAGEERRVVADRRRPAVDDRSTRNRVSLSARTDNDRIDERELRRPSKPYRCVSDVSECWWAWGPDAFPSEEAPVVEPRDERRWGEVAARSQDPDQVGGRVVQSHAAVLSIEDEHRIAGQSMHPREELVLPRPLPAGAATGEEFSPRVEPAQPYLIAGDDDPAVGKPRRGANVGELGQ